MRSCIGCRTVHPKGELVRFVLSPSAEAVADYNAKLPGRGVYLCPDALCVGKAVSARAFSKAFRQAVAVQGAPEICRLLYERAMAKALSYLSLSLRSGKLSLGTTAVEGELKKNHISLLLIHGPMAERTEGEWERMARARGLPLYELPVGEESERILGARKIIGIKDPGISAALAAEMERMRRLLPSGESKGLQGQEEVAH